VLNDALMTTHDNLLDAIGSTPLLRLTKVGRGLRCTFLGKLEMMNPGGSVKDRIGLPMIEAAEREGLLRPGGPSSNRLRGTPALAWPWPLR